MLSKNLNLNSIKQSELKSTFFILLLIQSLKSYVQ